MIINKINVHHKKLNFFLSNFLNTFVSQLVRFRLSNLINEKGCYDKAEQTCPALFIQNTSFLFLMLAFWQYNLRQLPLGFPVLGLLKLETRELLKKTILYNSQI